MILKLQKSYLPSAASTIFCSSGGVHTRAHTYTPLFYLKLSAPDGRLCPMPVTSSPCQSLLCVPGPPVSPVAQTWEPIICFGFSLYITPFIYTTVVEYFFLSNYFSYVAVPSEPVLYFLLLNYCCDLAAALFDSTFPLNLLAYLS